MGNARGPRAVLGGPPKAWLKTASTTKRNDSGEPPESAREPRALPETKRLTKRGAPKGRQMIAGGVSPGLDNRKKK